MPILDAAELAAGPAPSGTVAGAPSYDYVIIGGGAAGCVLAARLSEDPGVSVLVLEAGPAHAGVAEILDASLWVSLLRGPYDWGYDYAPAPHVDGRVIAIPRGRVLGGSSSINAMMWYRGHPRDYDLWAESGATGWDYETLLPYFRLVEDWEGGASKERGAGGPMRVERSRNPHPLATAMLEAAGELGMPVLDDPNGPSNHGAGYANFNATTTPEGRMERWSAARGYLEPALARPNLTVATGAQVLRVVLEGSRAAAVAYAGTRAAGSGSGSASAESVVRAERGVVMAAGAIDTPRLLMFSGIGDPAELSAVGIGVAHALPGVGRNYQDHPLLQGMTFRAKEPLGPVRDNGGGSMVNWMSSHADGRPDLHAFVAQGPQANPGLQQLYPLGDGPLFAVSPGLMGTRSVGWLKLRSADPSVPAEVQPNFYAEPEDLDALADGVEAVLELLSTSAYRELSEGPVVPSARLITARERRQFVRTATETFFHSCGTAKMGTDEEAVVGPDLAVHGLEGLWVADASVIPVIPSCNTLPVVLAVAERAAELIDGRSRLPGD